MKNNMRSLERLFNPNNVVIFKISKATSFFIDGFKRQGFDFGKLYLVSAKEKEFSGLKCYKSIEDVPEDIIDLLILSVRRELLIESLEDILSKKKVNFIHIFTAGTGEFDDIGVEIEKQLKELIDKYSHSRAIGPNCMGIYSPHGKTAYYSSFPVEEGNIGLIFQSGDLHSKMIKFGSRRYNLRFSIGISIGNCIDIQISELLEYLNKDVNTDVICVYFEGISPFHKNEGKRLFHILKKMKKPVLFMRGGRTIRGQSAVLTHTGALTAKTDIWSAIYRQTPIIEVPPSLDDLIDYAFLFSSYIYRFQKLKKDIIYPKNKRALVVLWSGGFGILATDTLVELGLELPYFEGNNLEKLKEIYPIKVGSLSNPFDLPWVTHQKVLVEVCKSAIDNKIDLVIVETDAWKDMESARFKGYYNNLLELRDYVESLNKVFLIILHQYPSKSQTKFHQLLIKDKFIVYPTIETAAKSFLKLYKFGKKLARIFQEDN
ncbi:MAG: CoA-binding protein [Candidatus Hodarchaeota archaeon]